MNRALKTEIDDLRRRPWARFGGRAPLLLARIASFRKNLHVSGLRHLLLVEPSPANTRERSVEIRDAVGNIGYPVDVIVMRTERFERTKRVIGGTAYPANKYGRVIYAAA